MRLQRTPVNMVRFQNFNNQFDTLKNVIQITPTGNPDYYAFGNGVMTDSDTILYANKLGPTHIGGTSIVMEKYTISTNVWAAPVTIAVTGDSDIYSGVSFGKIGTHLYCFVSKYNVGSDLFTNSGYIKSTDLTGTSWGAYVPITLPPYERFESYDQFHESVTTPGKFFTTRFSHKDGGTDPWNVEVIKIESDGATWTPIEVYDGLQKYSEMAITNVGGSVWIGLARKFEASGVFGLFHSTDDCETWALVGTPNIGVGPGQGSLLYWNNLIHFLFQNRTTSFIQVTKNNTLAQVLALTFNTPINYYDNEDGAINGLGYPWWTIIHDDVLYLTWCKETSTGEAHVLGTRDRLATII